MAIARKGFILRFSGIPMFWCEGFAETLKRGLCSYCDFKIVDPEGKMICVIALKPSFI